MRSASAAGTLMYVCVFITSMPSTPPAPKTAAQALERFENEQRTVDYVLLGPAQAGEIAPPTPEELAKYFSQRTTRFRAPDPCLAPQSGERRSIVQPRASNRE